MKIQIQINSQTEAIRKCFSEVTLVANGKENYCCKISLDYDTILRNTLGPITPVMNDWLWVSNLIYAIDKLVPRSDSIDGWTRDIELEIPVETPHKFNNGRMILQKALNFLTGDKWTICFIDLTQQLFFPIKRRSIHPIDPLQVAIVSLFSGGLDSLIGVIDTLATTSGTVVCVGHHDSSGDQSAQNRLSNKLEQVFSTRTKLISIFAAPSENEYDFESSLRSRSFLFLGLGGFIAYRLGQRRLVVPENGMIALNPPLTIARRGACSTRTVHPYFIQLYNKFLRNIDIPLTVENPYQLQTKGEMVIGCKNQELLKTAAPESVSCGKKGRFRAYMDAPPSAKQCGCCVPCLYRRAALSKLINSEIYGEDVVSGSFDISASKSYTFDFRDMLSFIKQNETLEKIEREIAIGTKLEPAEVKQYAELVLRGKREVLEWLQRQCSQTLRNKWGI